MMIEQEQLVASWQSQSLGLIKEANEIREEGTLEARMRAKILNTKAEIFAQCAIELRESYNGYNQIGP